VTVFAKCKFNQKDDKVTLKGKIDGRDKEWEIDVTDTEHRDLPMPILWARDRIRDFEESNEVFVGRGSRQTERKKTRVEDMIVELSKKYNLLSRLTSFVAIEEREEEDKTTGELVLRKVPAQVTVGWHGVGSLGGSGLRQRMVCFDRPPGPAMMEECSDLELRQTTMFSRRVKQQPGSNLPSRKRRASVDKTDIVLSILSLQRAKGGMKLNKRVSQSLGIEKMQLKKIANEIETEIDVDKFLLLSTAILLQVLEFRFILEYDTWAGAIKKSRIWLDDVLNKGNPHIYGEALMLWVENYVRGLATI
jgi:hypothetical protein